MTQTVCHLCHEFFTIFRLTFLNSFAGALKAAHTGISLSEAESSVASPFTSKNPTIACVPDIIKQGRAALVTSVGIFKYMAAYSLVQFLSVLILYSIDSNLTDIQFLYIDLFMISVFAFFFGRTEAFEGALVKQTPLSSLVSMTPIASLAFHLVIAAAFQVGGWFHLQAQDWYVPFNYTDEAAFNHGCVENYTVFTISCFQYVILAFVFSKGAPYRKSILTNYGFLAAIILNVAFSVWLTIQPPSQLASVFELILPPDNTFRTYIIAYGALNFVLSMLIEAFIIDKLFMRRLRYRFHNIEKSRRKFLSIENYLRQQPSWPPLSLYQNYLPTNEKETSTQAQTFAEIYVESGVDNELPFDQNNSVLNSFFEMKPTDTATSPHDNQSMQPMVNNNTARPVDNHVFSDESSDDDSDYDDDLNNSPQMNTNNAPSNPIPRITNDTKITATSQTTTYNQHYLNGHDDEDDDDFRVRTMPLELSNIKQS